MNARLLAILILFVSIATVWAQDPTDLDLNLGIEEVPEAAADSQKEVAPQLPAAEEEKKADEEKPSSKVEKIFNSDEEVVDITVDADEIPDEAKPENDVMVQSSIEAAEKARESDPAKTEEGADEKSDFVAEELPDELPEEEPEAPAADPAAASKQPAVAAGSYETLTPLEI
ncbi:MAG: hypothetical protein K6C40_12915, partial [Thermoguttaceae bacterium]|nr:hypothetical protein [Thermoguttaceae bacterium]